MVPKSQPVPFGHFMISGLHFKNITILNNATGLFSEKCDNLKRHLWSSIMLLVINYAPREHL
jgi:hypothetical protein